ncbi:uncharacterized protein LOC107019431 [Solanum pennellii]|uniref:Uncharacterized protein LOC107019431 n=1 Tax=Solanum pennellii TaxID=28526 RepID=A0ABM1GST2_SOLPN|nr:uncharacterized protein LOC107019431 [Solanum pennellii]
MPPRRANTKNVNAMNANAAPPLSDQEVSNVEFKNVIHLLVQSMTNQNNWVHGHVNENGGSAAARICDFVRMNLPKLLGSQTNEDPQNFLGEIKNISRLTTYAQQLISGGGNCSHSQLKILAPAPSSASVPSSKNRYDQKGRTPSSKSQGSVSGTKIYTTYPKCGMKHPGECLAGKEGSFGCGQSGHRAQCITSAALATCPTQQGNSSSTGSGQSQNKQYAFEARRDQEGSSDVVTGSLRVFNLDVYTLLDTGATLSSVTPYIAVQFSVSP